jgi:hypothetical protein
MIRRTSPPAPERRVVLPRGRAERSRAAAAAARRRRRRRHEQTIYLFYKKIAVLGTSSYGSQHRRCTKKILSLSEFGYELVLRS